MKIETMKAKAAEYSAALSSLNRSELTILNFNRIFNRFIEYLQGEETENEITAQSVAQWRQSLHDEGASANTIRQYLITLQGFFSWAMRGGLIADNPITAAGIPDRKAVNYTLLTKAEIETVINSSPVGIWYNEAKKRRAIALVFILCGLRSDELRSLTVADVDMNNGVLKVQHGKGDKYREAPFPKAAREAVQAYIDSAEHPPLDENSLLFGSEADENGHKTEGQWHKYSSIGINRMIKNYVQKLTGKEIHSHSLRHAAASVWDDMGIDMRNIQLALGHASLVTTEKIYVNILDKSRAANAINKAFDGAMASERI